MRQTISALKEFAGRVKLLSMLAALFMAGSLSSITATVWYYDRVISKVHGSYGGRIAAYNADIRRLKKEADHERDITRKQLYSLARHLDSQTMDVDKIADDVGRLLEMAQTASETAQKAATTARSAATTASAAAKNAANANIKAHEEPREWVKE